MMDDEIENRRKQLQAALEELEQEAERRRIVRGEPETVTIDTGVPRPPPCPADCTCWRHSKDTYDVRAEKERLAKHLEPKAPPPLPKSMAEPAPPSLPREWKYFYIQIRGPRDGDCGVIAEAEYGVAGNYVFVQTAKGDPILGRISSPSAVASFMIPSFIVRMASRPAIFHSPSVPSRGKPLSTSTVPRMPLAERSITEA